MNKQVDQKIGAGIGQEIGPKRLVVGAHYGLRDWLAQRATAVIMAIYTLIVLCVSFAAPDNVSFEDWTALFARPWFSVATFVALLALLFHAWIGVRDIWMDYIKPVALRLVLQVITIVWLVGCAVWAAQVLWRL